MESKSYKWLLTQLVNRKLPLKILEAGICRGDKLTDWFCTDTNGIVTKKSTKVINRTKYLLIHFLNACVPMLEQYIPDKVICYLYHTDGKRIILAKEVIELAENQLHGLQVRSIHMALVTAKSTDKIYKIKAWNEQGELHTELLYGKFIREDGEVARDVIISEKAMWLTMYIAETVYHTYCQFIESLKYEMVVDQSSQLYLLNITELAFHQTTSPSLNNDFRLRKKSFHRAMPEEEESSEDLTDEEVHKDELESRKTPLIAYVLKDFTKKARVDQNRFKISLEREPKRNSPTFLSMVANTIDKERRREINAKMFAKSRLEVVKQRSLSKRRIFHLNSLKSQSKLSSESQNITNLKDLLFYLEKTRPKNWIKDQPKELILSPGLDKRGYRTERNSTNVSDFSPPPTVSRHRKTQSSCSILKTGEALKLWLNQEACRLEAKHSRHSSSCK
ncbi:unnamed protein product [Blepharisma stoltei]|uniref:Uncharacterized protein n=1 Tax=Blepharisma stoltei TaxID=1481888 RepID=A0AAU9ISF5_9CILI|nr:unnamed protein product [Blepharisma stoltei]